MRLKNIPAAKSAVEKSVHCIQDPKVNKGQWDKVFSNNNPIYIEIGMGKGQFILAQAKTHPAINFIGLERYESVMYRAVQKLDALEEPPDNVKLICCDAAELVEFFAKGEVKRIYLNFSDPWPKARHAKRRLTSAPFLEKYAAILPNAGHIEFKTDNDALFTFSLEEIEDSPHFTLLAATDDLHRDAVLSQGNIMTEYEEKFASEQKAIHKLIAEFHEK